MATLPQHIIISGGDFGYSIPFLGRLLKLSGPKAKLLEAYFFKVGEDEFEAPMGYEWDGLSSPSITWLPPFNYHPFGESYFKAAIEHDLLCDIGKGGSEWLRGTLLGRYPEKLSSTIVHRAFFDSLIRDGVRPSQAKTMYQAVRLFGPKF